MEVRSTARVYVSDDIDGFLESVNFLIGPYGLEIISKRIQFPYVILEIKKKESEDK